MSTQRLWPVYFVLIAVLIAAVALVLPGASSAGPLGAGGEIAGGGVDGGGNQPVAKTGICVNGQVIDKAHVGLAGLKVTAETAGLPVLTAESDANGNFTFNDLAPAQYTFRVAVPASWEAITPAEFPLQLAYGHVGCYVVRFKVDPVGCIVVNKTDTQGNALPDWVIHVSGPVAPTGTTGADGSVRFDKLIPGTYGVSEELKYPWKALSPTAQTVKVHAAQDDKDCTAVTFKNELQPTTCINGTKIDDQHRGLPDWNIFAQPTAGGPLFMTQTGADGSFHFPNLTLGQWTVWEEVPAGWTPVTPAKFTVTLTTAGDKDCVVVRFKNRPPDLCAEGLKVNEKGVGLPDWVISASSLADPATVMTTTTDAQGHYRFVGLTLGTWVFSETHQTGWTAITSDTVKVDVTAGRSCTQVPIFRNRAPQSCIEGIKRDDPNGKVPSAGLPGWSILLQPTGGGAIQKRITDGTGAFRFDGLPVGDYDVWEQPQVGWEPVSPTKVTVTVAASDEPLCSRVEFINRQTPRDICIDGFKLDSHGNVGLPGFTMTAEYLGPSKLVTTTVMTATTDGIGYYRFSSLTPGSYKVSVGEMPGWSPVGASSRTVKVDWPPKYVCTRANFWDRQGTPPPVDPPSDNSSNNSCRAWHSVKSGQTLAGVAAQYGTTIRALLQANYIPNVNVIRVGQRLCIP
jgi:hypothetical protein